MTDQRPRPDLLRDAWRALFVGDAPGNRILRTRADGTSEVVAFVPTGATEPRTVMVGQDPVQVHVPSLREELVATGTLTDVVEALRPRPTPEDNDSPITSAGDLQATTTDLGTVADWLSDHGDTPEVDGLVRGDLATCPRCSGTGRAYQLTCDCRRLLDIVRWELSPADPDCTACGGSGETDRTCDQCAGTGRRRTRLTVRFHDPSGHTQDAELSAATARLLRRAQTTTGRASRTPAGGRRTTERTWFLVGWPGDGATGGLGLPDPDRMLVLRDGYAYPGPHERACVESVEDVIRVMFSLIPAGSHPDLNAGWRDPTDEERQRRLATYVYDPAGRLVRQDWHVRERRPLTEAWAELTGCVARLERALPDGWHAQAWLSTDAIATGEHGPRVQLVAIPSYLLERPIAVVSELDHDLETALETAVYNAAEAGPDALAAAAVLPD